MIDDDNSLRVLIVTVDEYFYIPKFLDGVLQADGIEVVGVTGVPPSLGNQSTPRFAWGLFRRFGAKIFAKQLAFYGKHFFFDMAHRLTGTFQPYSPKTLARTHDVEYKHVSDVNTEQYFEYVRSKSPDVVASVAAPQKFDAALLDIPDHGTINIHSSLLPDYRGLSPSFWTLRNEESRTGITVHYMDEGLDTGDVIVQEPLDISEIDTLHTLNTRVAEAGSPLLVEALEQIRTGTVERTEIDPDDGSYYSLPSRDDVRTFLDRGNSFY